MAADTKYTFATSKQNAWENIQHGVTKNILAQAFESAISTRIMGVTNPRAIEYGMQILNLMRKYQLENPQKALEIYFLVYLATNPIISAITKQQLGDYVRGRLYIEMSDIMSPEQFYNFWLLLSSPPGPPAIGPSYEEDESAEKQRHDWILEPGVPATPYRPRPQLQDYLKF